MNSSSSTLRAVRRGTLVFTAALLAVSIGVASGKPQAAIGNTVVAGQPAATMHQGVDWSRVAAMPVDTGATVGAYDR